MHSNSLRPHSLAPLSLVTLLATACAQAQQADPKHLVVGSTTPAPGGAGAKDPRLEGLPTFLLMVPGGTVEVGMTTEQLVAAACQAISPTRPAMAAKSAPEKLITAMKRTVSALGRQKVTVDAFLLARWPVKCAEYETYIRLRRQQNAKVRAPFGWWRFGCAEDYDTKLPEINQQFPKMKDGPVQFWERHGDDLPYKLQDEKGRSIADLPVTYVNYREANEFAGWLGMRLPTEVEWTRAGRGDGANVWPWAKAADPTTDVFTEDALKQLSIFTSRDQVLKAVGTVPAGTGPYGHLDMFGQVWQLVADLGYRPIRGADVFATEWKLLQKDKTGAMLQSPPNWKDDKAIGKGGSYLSFQEPVQLLVDARAPVQTIDVMESLGFRLAKSLKPGYDVLYSKLHGFFNRGPFAADQEVDLAAQVGAERYELGANGFPTAYHAVSFAPVNWLSKEKGADLQKLLEKSETTPFLIGAFATTADLIDPAVPPGIYIVQYRKEGMPRELGDAIKTGHKELGAMGKSKAKEGDKPEEGAPEEKDKDKPGKEKKAGWREVIQRYGITEKDLETKEAAHGLKFVRIDGVEVSTEHGCFLLLGGTDAKLVAAIPASNQTPVAGTPFPSELVLEADKKGKAIAKFRFGMPLQPQNGKKIVDFHFQVTLDRPAPTAETPWRLP